MMSKHCGSVLSVPEHMENKHSVLTPGMFFQCSEELQTDGLVYFPEAGNSLIKRFTMVLVETFPKGINERFGEIAVKNGYSTLIKNVQRYPGFVWS